MSIRNQIILFTLAILVVGGFVFYRTFQYRQLRILNEQRITAQELLQIPLLPNDPIQGDLRSPITVVAFEDLGCSGCATQNTLLKSLLEKHPGQIKIIWKLLPVTTIPFPTRQANDFAFCAHKQNKFQEFKDLAFQNRLTLNEETLREISLSIDLNETTLNTCLNSPEPTEHNQQNELIARSLQIQAVPAFFIDNTQIQNPTSVAGWESLLGL